MKLYEIEFTVTAIVAAESKAEASLIADQEWREIKSDTSDDDICIDIVREINNIEQLTYPWDGDCFPYGPPAADKRIKDYLEE